MKRHFFGSLHESSDIKHFLLRDNIYLITRSSSKLLDRSVQEHALSVQFPSSGPNNFLRVRAHYSLCWTDQVANKIKNLGPKSFWEA